MDFLELDSLLDIFDHHARDTPDAPFLSEDLQASLSYRESYVLIRELLGPRLREICPGLIAQGSTPQPRVLLVAPNNSLLLLTILALWRLSCVAVLVQPRAEPELWTGMISCSKPALVIAASSMIAQVKRCVAEYDLAADTDTTVISLTSLIPLDYRNDNETAPRVSNFIPSCRRWIQSLSPDRTIHGVASQESVVLIGNAVTLFTSSAVDQGSVKGVTYTHKFLVSSSIRTAQTMGVELHEFYKHANRHLGWMPLSHCFEFGISFW